MAHADRAPTLAARRDPRHALREQVREQLLVRSHLFEDADTYRAGVLDTLEAIEAHEAE